MRSASRVNHLPAPGSETRRNLRYQDDLPARIAFQNLVMRFGGVGQWHFHIDDRPKNSSFQRCTQGTVYGEEVGVGGEHQGHAADVGVAGHRLPRVDLDAASIAHDHDAAIARQHRQILVEVDVGEHLDDRIYAAAAGQSHQLFEVVGGGVVEDVVGAFL